MKYPTAGKIADSWIALELPKERNVAHLIFSSAPMNLIKQNQT
jgi:hypothetical protein